MENCGNITEVKQRDKRMRCLQVSEIKKVISILLLKYQLSSKSHIWKIAVFKHGNFPLI
jgi:hypothetical protein